MAKKIERKSATQGQEGRWESQPGVVMVTLWVIGMVFFCSLALTLHLVASVLTRLYAAG